MVPISNSQVVSQCQAFFRQEASEFDIGVPQALTFMYISNIMDT